MKYLEVPMHGTCEKCGHAFSVIATLQDSSGEQEEQKFIVSDNQAFNEMRRELSDCIQVEIDYRRDMRDAVLVGVMREPTDAECESIVRYLELIKGYRQAVAAHAGNAEHHEFTPDEVEGEQLKADAKQHVEHVEHVEPEVAKDQPEVAVETKIVILPPGTMDDAERLLGVKLERTHDLGEYVQYKTIRDNGFAVQPITDPITTRSDQDAINRSQGKINAGIAADIVALRAEIKKNHDWTIARLRETNQAARETDKRIDHCARKAGR